jgi:hypothetical protein
MANKKLPTQADLKAALEYLARWSNNRPDPHSLHLAAANGTRKFDASRPTELEIKLLKTRDPVHPGVHVDVRHDFGVPPDFKLKPGLIMANSWATESDHEMSLEDTSLTHSIFAVDREPNLTFAEVAASVDSIKAALKERLPVPQQRPYVTNVEMTYEEQQFDGIGRHASYGGPGRVKLRVEMTLPPDVNPNDYVEMLKTLGDTGMPYLPRPEQRGAETERQMAELVELVDQYKRDVERLQAETNTHKETLLRLRQRMNMAMEAREDPETARELFAELVDNWASKLAEGATFTAAEGDELVAALVASLEYMDLARETRRLERKESRSSKKKKKPPDDHLF